LTEEDIKKIEEYFVQLGIDPKKALVAPNTWTFKQNDLDVFVIATAGFFIVQSTIMNTPKENLANFYRTLLELNDNAEQTMGATFGINSKNEVVLKILRPIGELDQEEFTYNVTTVAFVGDKYQKQLTRDFDV
jgi:hypothetical protein